MISQDTIQEVKDKADIVQVISEKLPLKQKGNKYFAKCPFHDEKSESFCVTPNLQIYKCFGCGESGDVFSFLMKHEKLDYPNAVRQLAQKYNVKLVEENNNEDKQVTERKTLMYELNAIALRYFQEELRKKLDNEPEHWVTREVYDRRNFHPDAIADFKLGYAPAGWQFLCKKFSAEQLPLAKDLGLVVDKNGKRFDRFRDRLIYPIIDTMGRVVAFTGRKSFECTNADSPKYHNSPDSMIFNKGKIFFGLNLAEREIRSMGFAYLVEGQADVIQMHQAKIYNTIATSGTALTESHATLLKRHCKVAHIMTDGDKAGEKATMAMIDILIAEDISPYVIRLPDNEDPDSFIRKQQEVMELEGLKA